ncbi:MAG TPA: energy transducer TonB [Thermoanaerobaculia bacterium]|nr:energy transducer TonB [Thermoanaerobaculia bacterium]
MKLRSLLAVLLFLLSSLSLADSQPIQIDDRIERPVKISGALPKYPEEARKARVSGVVTLEAVIDEQGNVTDVKVLKGLPMGLDQAAIDAVKTWKFKPATLDGKPVKVYYTLTVTFTMESGQDEGPGKLFSQLMEANPELKSLVQSQRLPDALAFLEDQPPTPAVRVGRCYLLMALRRFDEALVEARAYDGPDRDQILHFIAINALQTLDRRVPSEMDRAAIVDTGIQAASDALEIRKDYQQAMRTKSLLLRKKAESAVDPERAALLSEAEDLEKRAAATP